MKNYFSQDRLSDKCNSLENEIFPEWDSGKMNFYTEK